MAPSEETRKSFLGGSTVKYRVVKPVQFRRITNRAAPSGRRNLMLTAAPLRTVSRPERTIRTQNSYGVHPWISRLDGPRLARGEYNLLELRTRCSRSVKAADFTTDRSPGSRTSRSRTNRADDEQFFFKPEKTIERVSPSDRDR